MESSPKNPPYPAVAAAGRLQLRFGSHARSSALACSRHNKSAHKKGMPFFAIMRSSQFLVAGDADEVAGS